MDYSYVKKRARELRKNQTRSGDTLWQMLRNRKFHELKFLRQHPIACGINGRRHFFISRTRNSQT